MDTQNKNEDVINAVLFGDDIKYVGGWNVWNGRQTFKNTIENMIKNAKTHEDLNAIGAKFNEAIDKKYVMDKEIWDYQILASKKMREIYNAIGEPVKGERIKVKRSDLN